MRCRVGRERGAPSRPLTLSDGIAHSSPSCLISFVHTGLHAVSQEPVCSHLRTFALAPPTAWNGSFLDILKTHNTTSFKSLLQCHFLRIIPTSPLPTLQISFLCPPSSFFYNIYHLLTCCIIYILINESRGLPCIGFIPSA